MRRRVLQAVLFLFLPLPLLALGLGDIHLRSHLNEPFYAEIPLLDVEGIHLSSIKVSIGAPEEFGRIGMVREEVLSFLRLSVKRDEEGRPIVLVTSVERIQTPYLDLLIDLNWPQGELYRVYHVLIDPPHYALDEGKGAFNRAFLKGQVGGREGFSRQRWLPGAQEEGGQISSQRASSTYGPTLLNENIWQIAKRYQDDRLTLPQVVLSIVGQNPDAFSEGNLNGLKMASRLSIPSSEKMHRVPTHLAAQESELHDVAWHSHSPIHHVLFPPYVPKEGESLEQVMVLHSVLPVFPGFAPKEEEGLPQPNLPKESKPSQDMKTEAVASQLTVIEKKNLQLTQALKAKTQENQALIQQLTILKKQRGGIPPKPAEEEQSTFSGWIWIFIGLLLGAIGYSFWKRYRKVKVKDVEEELSVVLHHHEHPLETSFSPPPNKKLSEPEVSIQTEINQPTAEEPPASALTLTESESAYQTEVNQPVVEETPVSAPTPTESEAAFQVEISQPPATEPTPVEGENLMQFDEKPHEEGEADSPSSLPESALPESGLVKSRDALETLMQLAKTYMSRGDLQACKQALQEVAAFGDEKQQKEAALLLAQLDEKK